MKRTLSFMVMALALLLTQCRKPEVKFPSPVAPEGTTVSMTVTAGPGGKTDITTAGGITWSEGDKLYVGFGGEYVGYLTLTSGVGTPTGWFSGDVTLPNGTTGDQTFDFFYLGNAKDYSTELASHNTYVDVSFAEQEIHADANHKLVNASKHHVGYGSAKGTVAGSEVTGINVTLVSKVALARFSFTAGTSPYEGELTLSGDHIYNSMTVGFGGTFTGEKTDGGNISLGAGHAERYVMLVPAGTGSKTLNFVGGATGSTTLANGIEANKFYGKESAVEVPLAYKTVNFGTPNLNWSVCNLGATNGGTPESWYGDYYAWGATETWYSAGGQTSSPTWKDGFSDGYTWEHCPGNGGNSSYNEAAFIPWKYENLTDDYLNSGVDAASAALGDGWRMPTGDDWQDLSDSNTFEWLAAGDDSEKVESFTAVAAGYLVIKGKDGSLDPTVYMFLPAAGCRSDESLSMAGKNGYYWTSENRPESPQQSWIRFMYNTSVSWAAYTRNTGCSVRPVRLVP